MDVKNQVCTLEQAKRLIELGISAPGIFSHFKAISHSGWALSNIRQKHVWAQCGVSYYEDEIEYTTVYTVAELGVMIDDFIGHIRRVGHGWEVKFKPRIPPEKEKFVSTAELNGAFITRVNEAQARGHLLIYLLETGWLDAGKCNERLMKKEAPAA